MVGVSLYAEMIMSSYNLPIDDCLPKVLTGKLRRHKCSWRWSPKNQLIEVVSEDWKISYSLHDGICEVKERSTDYNFWVAHEMIPPEVRAILEGSILDANNKAWRIIDLSASSIPVE